MSNYARGVLDGVVHYCDRDWWSRRVRVLLPWCLLDIHKHLKKAITPAAPVAGKRVMVTCFLCLGIRRKRP